MPLTLETIHLYYPPATGPDGKQTFFPAFIEHFGVQRTTYEDWAQLQQQPPPLAGQHTGLLNPDKKKEFDCFVHYNYVKDFCKTTDGVTKKHGYIWGPKTKEAEWVRLLVKYFEKLDDEKMATCIGNDKPFPGKRGKGLGWLKPEGGLDWRLAKTLEEVRRAKKKLFTNKVYEIRDHAAEAYWNEMLQVYSKEQIREIEPKPEVEESQIEEGAMKGVEMDGSKNQELHNDGTFVLAFRPR